MSDNHGHSTEPIEIIAEYSPQDWFLILIAAFALFLLLWTGLQWAFQ